ncbi:N-acetylneuraminate synthase family protein [Candidatus Aerophobetes bacterium]|nr:N-acetylneuraminate synthase family protein [Candidatus Aerophobetes bacterium]
MRKIRIGNRWIGEEEPTFIITEIGSNHNGRLEQAKRLIEASKKAGANAVKFQSFTPEELVNPKILNDHAQWVKNPAWDMLTKLQLPVDWYRELKEFCDKLEIIFLSTPFDIERANLLNEIGVDAFKIASGDLTFYPLIKHIAKFRKPIILSTGMAYLNEVKRAVDVIKDEGNEKIILLHCVSNYPAKLEDANIKAMITMRDTFNLPVGYSDHTLGYVVPLGAVALGACVIEKHITLDRRMEGPDHPFALEVAEFSEMVKKIRELEKALGDGKKKPVVREMPERKFARRGIYAKFDIPRGKILREEMIKMVRPAYEDGSKEPQEILNRRTKVSIRKDEPVTLKKICEEI